MYTKHPTVLNVSDAANANQPVLTMLYVGIGVAKESNANDTIAALKEKPAEEIDEDTDIDQGMNLGM